MGTSTQNADTMDKKKTFGGGPTVEGQTGKHFRSQTSGAEPGEESKNKCVGPLAFHGRTRRVGTAKCPTPKGEKPRSFNGETQRTPVRLMAAQNREVSEEIDNQDGKGRIGGGHGLVDLSRSARRASTGESARRCSCNMSLYLSLQFFV